MAANRHRPEPGESTPAAAAGAPPAEAAPPGRRGRRGRRGADAAATMIPARSGRTAVESFFMRIIATAGIVGIGVAIAAIMQSQRSHGWLIGLVVSAVSVLLAAVLWSSRRL